MRHNFPPSQAEPLENVQDIIERTRRDLFEDEDDNDSDELSDVDPAGMCASI
jgi:hypothetical protein